jgi:hypothetical protein
MADIVYYANEMDANGELHFKRVETHTEYNEAHLHVQAVDSQRSVIIVDHPRTDPTLAEFYEPEPRNSEQGDG